MIEAVLPATVGAVMVAAAVYDAATLRIPNWISLVLIALFPVVAIAAGLSWGEAGWHVAIGFAALLAGMGLFATGAIGGGDAKLFAAVALYVGAAWFLPYIFVVALAGGVLALIVIVLRWAAKRAGGVAWLDHLAKAGAGLPYGVAIVAGGLFVLPQTQLFSL